MTPTVRLMTWNVFHCRDGRASPAPDRWSVLLRRPRVGDGYIHLNRKHTARMGELIRDAGADVVLVQEVPPTQLRRLAAAAGMRAAWSVRTGPHVGGVRLRGMLGTANPDLFRSHEGNANAVMLGPHMEVRGPARTVRLNPAGPAVRAAVHHRLAPRELWRWLAEPRRAVAVCAAPPGGRAVWFACVHLHGSRTAWQTMFEMTRLARWLEDLGGPVVVGGDLNAPPAHPAMAALRRCGVDTAAADPALTIDRILVRDLRTVEPEHRWPTAQRTVPVRHRGATHHLRLSDHDPVERAVAVPPA